MKRRYKFTNVDIISVLKKILEQNTGFYQSDLDIDKEIIMEAAESQSPMDRVLLWMSRPCGSHCFKERDVFIKETSANSTWRYYTEQTSDRVLSYALVIREKSKGRVTGDIYELDYAEHYERVKKTAVASSRILLVYEKGEYEIPAGQYFNGSPDKELGKFVRFDSLPNDPDALGSILSKEKTAREKLPEGDLARHIAELRSDLIKQEAGSVARSIAGKKGKDPDRTFDLVSLSPVFLKLASDADLKKMFRSLPYKIKSYSKVSGTSDYLFRVDYGSGKTKTKTVPECQAC